LSTDHTTEEKARKEEAAGEEKEVLRCFPVTGVAEDFSDLTKFKNTASRPKGFH
jgi:hypothetical protein